MKESELYIITCACPKLNRTIACPLLEIEHLSFKEKIIWVAELNDEKKEAILTHHENCKKSKK
ncbi:MAG: hypothetical protein PF541_10385 [Prolixibacteraceae bacterium]|nr:hypothetical protein [Prolixibacteraceae bacterium]